MRLLMILMLPVALAACPATLSDWTIEDRSFVVGLDAASPEGGPSVDAGSSDAATEGGDGDAGSSLGDGDATPAPEEASGSSSGSSSGSTSSSGSSSGATVACDGAGLSVHHTGTGLTWTDCVPVGTYDAAEALKACETWCAVNGCSSCSTGSRCGIEYIVGQTATVAQMGWSWLAPNAGNAVSIDPTQPSCTLVGTWN